MSRVCLGGRGGEGGEEEGWTMRGHEEPTYYYSSRTSPVVMF